MPFFFNTTLTKQQDKLGQDRQTVHLNTNNIHSNKKTTTQVNVEGVFDVQCVKAEHRHYFC